MELKGNYFNRISLTLAVLFFDQASKFMVIQSLVLGEVKVFNDWFNLVLRQNRGISFGLFPAHSLYAKILLIGLILGLMLWIVYHFWTSLKSIEILGYAFILGGALGNLCDRFYREGVVDFLEFHINQYYWPAFNIADSFIVVGAILIFGSQTWQSCGQLKMHT